MEHNKIQTLCMIPLFTAIIVILAQFSIPLPVGVPLSMQNAAVLLAAALLGKRNGTLSVLIYLFLGCIGLPVFANFRGGLQTFLSPTGGFLLGYPGMAYIIGTGSETSSSNIRFFISILFGLAFDYLIGIAMFCFITSTSIKTGILTCILPFLPTDLLKVILISLLSPKIKKSLHVFMQPHLPKKF